MAIRVPDLALTETAARGSRHSSDGRRNPLQVRLLAQQVHATTARLQWYGAPRLFLAKISSLFNSRRRKINHPRATIKSSFRKTCSWLAHRSAATTNTTENQCSPFHNLTHQHGVTQAQTIQLPFRRGWRRQFRLSTPVSQQTAFGSPSILWCLVALLPRVVLAYQLPSRESESRSGCEVTTYHLNSTGEQRWWIELG